MASEALEKEAATGPHAVLESAASQATLNTKPLFKLMVEKKASDLFFTANAPIKIKIEGQIFPVNKNVLTADVVRQTAFALMTAQQREEFLAEFELDFAISEPGLGRFRVNVFLQRGFPAMVLRYISADMPRLEHLGLPDIMRDLIIVTRAPRTTSSPSRIRSSSCTPTSARSSTSVRWGSTPSPSPARSAASCAPRPM
jgi:hypothetical protein